MKHLSNQKSVSPAAQQRAKKSLVSTKKVASVEKKPSVSATKTKADKVKTPAIKAKTQNAEKSTAAKNIPTSKSQPRISAEKKTPDNDKNKQAVKTEKNLRLPTIIAIKKAKVLKSEVLIKTQKPVKSQQKIAPEKVQPKNSGAKSKTIIEDNSAKKDAVTKEIKFQKLPVKVENKQVNSRISKLPKVENEKIVAVHLVKKLELPEIVAAPKSKKNSRPKTVKPIEIKAEPPVLETPKPKKAKAISSAVFRGAKKRYDFTVFPLDSVFEDVPAIYIISRRVVDKSKKAHHALVCIGQTESLLEELKKHLKDKRARKFAANSISLLHEENENRRLKIETDLKAAHAIRCLYV